MVRHAGLAVDRGRWRTALSARRRKRKTTHPRAPQCGEAWLPASRDRRVRGRSLGRHDVRPLPWALMSARDGHGLIGSFAGSHVVNRLHCGCESLVFVIHNGYTLPPFDRCCFSFQSWRFGSCKTRLLRPLLGEVARGLGPHARTRPSCTGCASRFSTSSSARSVRCKHPLRGRGDSRTVSALVVNLL